MSGTLGGLQGLGRLSARYGSSYVLTLSLGHCRKVYFPEEF